MTYNGFYLWRGIRAIRLLEQLIDLDRRAFEGSSCF